MKQFLVRRGQECGALGQWLLRYWFVALPVLALYAVAQHFLFVNLTPSLPYRLVWLEYGAQPARGDLVVYRYAGTPLPGYGYLDGVRFFKRVAGLPGDVIAVRDRVVTVAAGADDSRSEIEIGYAKPHTASGVALEPIAAGTIPAGHLFAQSDSPDSFDSRYASSGLVPIERVIGVAHVIF